MNMSRNVCFLVLVAFIIPLGLFGQQLSVLQAEEDIDYLEKQLISLHPGLNRYASTADLSGHFERLKKVGGASTIELFSRVRFLLSIVKCGHTNASFPLNVYEKFVDSRNFLPLMVRFSGERLCVTNASLSDSQLQEGDCIVSINGKSVKEITDVIFDHLPADGFIETGKYRYAETFFYYYHQLFADTTRYDSFSLELIGRNGKVSKVEIEGKELSEVEGIREIDNNPLLKMEHHDDYSYLRIRTFSSSTLSQAGFKFNRFLSDTFSELKKRQTENLILDLRGNGGGDDDFGATLVSYFADEPFRYFDNIQVTDSYNGYGRIEEKNGIRYMTSHDGLKEWKPQKDRFKGNVFVLTDGFSFSTCADVATVLDHNKWATLVGEETGGGYDGNTSGSTQTITLPNSKIQVRIPMWMYTTANLGHKFYGRGAIPDFPVEYSIQDYLNDRDPVLQKAIELIKQAGR